MEISKYGVTLRRITVDKIEMIRQWRNDPKIVKFMEFKEFITPEMQEVWFEKINNEQNYFFLIIIDNQEIGLINVKDIDSRQLEGEAGIFIYDDNYYNSTASFQASFALYDFCFDTLRLDRVVAHILKENKRAIKFNKLIGYKIVSGQDDVKNQLYYLIKSEYQNVKKDFITLFD
ncbi:MAG: GNAT family N-acetyltransferase; N-acetyltransferase [Paludibacteraceae bacterium]